MCLILVRHYGHVFQRCEFKFSHLSNQILYKLYKCKKYSPKPVDTFAYTSVITQTAAVDVGNNVEVVCTCLVVLEENTLGRDALNVFELVCGIAAAVDLVVCKVKDLTVDDRYDT